MESRGVDAETDEETGVSWEAPGPGCWALDRSHYPGGTTPIAAWLMETAMSEGPLTQN
ncbi:MAG: hypothetical protein AAGG08_14975 [Actinomycetota bacterium]